jgi:hypothetical protein
MIGIPGIPIPQLPRSHGIPVAVKTWSAVKSWSEHLHLEFISLKQPPIKNNYISSTNTPIGEPKIENKTLIFTENSEYF